MAMSAPSVSGSIYVSFDDLKLSSKIVTIHNTVLNIELYLSNQQKNETANVIFQISLNQSPANVRSVVLFYRLYCRQSRTLYKQAGILIKRNDKIEWPSNQLQLSELNRKNNCAKFEYDIELLHVMYKNDSSLLGGLVGRNRSVDEEKLFHYRPLATTSQVKFEWHINDKVMELFKNAHCGKSYCSIDINSLWCACCYPNGDTTENEGKLILALKLLRLPPNIHSIDVALTFETKGQNITVFPHHRDSIVFSYKNFEYPWFDHFFPTASLWSLDLTQLTFIVSIEIKKVYLETGKSKGKKINRKQWIDYGIDAEYEVQMSGQIDDGNVLQTETEYKSSHHKSQSQPQIEVRRKQSERNDYMKERHKSEDYNFLFDREDGWNESKNNIMDIPEDNEILQTYDNEGQQWRNENVYQKKFRQWLEDKVKLPKYLPYFAKHGEVDVRRIRMFTDNILQSIGIVKETDRKLILEEARNFEKLKTEFSEWLDSNKVLRPFAEIFKENGILTWSDLENDILDKSQLKYVLKVASDHRIDEIWDLLHPFELELKQEITQLEQQQMGFEQNVKALIENLQTMQNKLASIPSVSINQKQIKQKQSAIIIGCHSVLKNSQKLLEKMQPNHFDTADRSHRTTIIVNNTYAAHIDMAEIKFREWLSDKVFLGNYFSHFKAHGCAKIEAIKHFYDSQLRDSIGITDYSHRKRILSKAKEFKQSQEEFEDMIEQNDALKPFQTKFKSNAIVTIDDLRNSIQTTKDIQNLLGLPSNDPQMHRVMNAIKKKRKSNERKIKIETVTKYNTKKSSKSLLPIINDSVNAQTVYDTVIISDTKTFCSQKNGEIAVSKSITVNDVNFTIELCPNGRLFRNAQQLGYVQFAVNAPALKNIKAMVILCRLYCKQTNSFFKRVKMFRKEKDCIEWSSNQLQLSKCAAFKTLEFVCCMELLHVKYSETNSLFGGLVQKITRSSLNPNIFHYKDITTRSLTKFEWKLSKTDLKLFQNSNTGQSYCSIDIDEMWSLLCFPNGDVQHTANNFLLSLQLMRLPAHVISIEVDLSVHCKTGDRPKYEKKNVVFNYNHCSHRFWPSTNIIPYWSLSRLSELQFEVEITIKKIFEDKTSKKGKEVPKKLWHNYGLQQMCERKVAVGLELLDNCTEHKQTYQSSITDSETEEKSGYSQRKSTSITRWPYDSNRNTITSRVSTSSFLSANSLSDSSHSTHYKSDIFTQTTTCASASEGIRIREECKSSDSNDLFKCGIVAKLYKYLEDYQNKYETFEKLYGDKITKILNAYHHMIEVHSNEHDFDAIYDAMCKKMHCDINKCGIVAKTDKFDASVVGVMDMIHIALYHSYQFGYRKRIGLDFALSRAHKQDSIKKIRSKAAFSHNKFKTNEKMNRDNYAYGIRYYYWDSYKNNENYVSMGKSKNLKDEIINNYLDIAHYNDVRKKANQLLSTKYAKQIKTIVSKHGLALDTRLKLANIMVVSMYCANSQLSYNFSMTFRKLNKNESLSEMKARNRKYWWMSKILRETVECYGKKLMNSESKKYYHGISSKYLFDLFVVRLSGPISTTTSYDIASIFGGTDGIVVEFTEYDESLTFFNCKYISPYTYEEERLFFGGNGKVQITGFTLLNYGNEANDSKYYGVQVKAVRRFHCFVRGSESKEEYDCDQFENNPNNQKEKPLMKKISRQDTAKELLMIEYKNEINKLIDIAFGNNIETKQEYIHRIFAAFCQRRKNVKINVEEMYRVYASFSEIFGGLPLKNMFQIDKIVKIFPNCRKITIECGGIYREINDEYVNALVTVLKSLPFACKLKCINLLKIESRINLPLVDLRSKFADIGWNITLKNQEFNIKK